jgi:UDPglucose 6-dehydrogenase
MFSKQINIDMKKVAMIGVGKLGQDCAEVMAEQYDVVGYDVEPRNPAFPMMLTIQEAVKDRDIIFIAAPTPHDPMYGGETPTSHLPNKDFDYSIVTDILSEVNKYVSQSQLVVLISTVLPGTVRRELKPCITNARFIYNPYLIAMGTTKWDMVNPEMLIIGTEDGSTTGDAKELIDLYAPLMQNEPRIEVGTWDEAESIKIFYNTFISTKVALVNMIQDVAERSGNIDVDVVTNALSKSTHRIMGPAYMIAGMGDGGACHPRDNIALRHLADKLNLGYDLFDSIMTAREKQASNLALKCLEYGRAVTIIGKAYKPSVPYTNGSSSLLVGYYITNNGGSVEYYDVHTGDNYIPARNPVFLIGYWEQWVEEFPFPPGSIVIDPWRKIKPNSNIAKIIHYGNTREQSPTYIPIKYDSTPPWYTMQMWPELATKDKACVLYAGRNDNSVLYLSSDVLVELVNENLSKGKEILVFDNSHETFIEDEVSKIYEILPNINIDAANIYYITNSSDVVDIHEQLCERRGWENPINIVVLRAFEFITKHFTKTEHHDKPYVVGPREKKFLCLNRNPHWHRTCLLGLMIEQDLLDKAYYSFYDDSYCVSKISDSCIKSRMSKETAATILNNIKEFHSSLPLKLTLDDAGSNPTGLHAQDVELFDNSYFSVIAETYYFTNSFLNELDTVFLTEKTYNAIIMKHPFILVAMPNSLEQLRHAGYKTFHPFIDESYDTATNDEERLKLIVAEVERLCNLSEEELTVWQENIKDTVEHNYEVLINRISYVRMDNNNNE